MKASATGVTDSCEQSCGGWELNPAPLEAQSMLLNTEPFLWPPSFFLNVSMCLFNKTFKCVQGGRHYGGMRDLSSALTRLVENQLASSCYPLAGDCDEVCFRGGQAEGKQKPAQQR